ncbi:DUF3667 domain-containing protein [Pseudoxanthomonas wuyuanensis]|nr:DUF3667 domain-containing protein [Pseudoxanthomonas wuyuanensis]KAF1720115.1 DUF3667 domain-containing protein [Pseudoxanthomonas wuyuanensis]
MSEVAGPHPTAQCENCATPLQGDFCHRCGQTAHSPLRSFGHAIEDFFESFWHLDGRVFRTLSELLWPGRLANAYLAGHRAPYVPPLRLFVILSVLTFFLAKYALQFGDIPNPPAVPATAGQTVSVAADDPAAAGGVDFQRVQTAEAVIRLRDETIEGLFTARAAIPAALAFPRQKIEENIRATQARARLRIAALQPDHPALSQPDPFPEAKPLPDPAAGSLFSHRGKPWDPVGNPVRLRWLPEFGNRWLNKKIARAEENIPRMQKDPELFKHAFLGAIPSALFVLVPVFALLLKLGYLETRRLYLEHLAVALYSHAFLCVALLAFCLLAMLDGWLGPHAGWSGYLTVALEILIVLWMPVYLLLMQQRVYRQHPLLTLFKYVVLGSLYFFLVMMAAMFLMVTSIVNA